jgi:predicted AAA+ superfamily ATPase
LEQRGQSVGARAHIVRSYLPREAAPQVSRLLTHMPVVVVTGMRQVGKSTMLVNDPRFEGREYISLDDPAFQFALTQSPDSELASHDRLTIDEAQRVEKLFESIKRAVEMNRTNGRFLLSGSTSFTIRKGMAESLAGIAIYLRMLPLTRREILKDTEKEPLLLDFIKKPRRIKHAEAKTVTDSEVMRGGMPGVVLASKEVGRVWLEAYEQTYLERDVYYVSRIEDILGFKNLLRLLAARTGQVLNLGQAGSDAGLAFNTAKRYLGLMDKLFVVRMVEPFTQSLRTRVRKAPKLFLSDSGIACALAGCHDLKRDPLRGFMYETYFFQNLMGILETHTTGWTVSYWRVNEKQEVDLVLDTRSQVVGVEVKSGERLDAADVRGLRSFIDATPRCELCILAYNGTETVSLGDGIWAVPLGLLIA